MSDYYSSINELMKFEKEGVDYRIISVDNGSKVTIAAPHGGKIEFATSIIAKKIAGTKYNLYLFEGVTETTRSDRKNSRLHIKSTNFYEDKLDILLKKSMTVISIHGVKGDDETIYVGGLNNRLKYNIIESLILNGFKVEVPHVSFPGIHQNNFINRVQHKGVQIELSAGFRKTIVYEHKFLTHQLNDSILNKAHIAIDNAISKTYNNG